MNMINIDYTEEIYSVSRLNREVRFLLEGSFPPLWIEGEISNFSAPHSGHWYFSLKDENSQVRSAMFRPHNRKLTFTPKDGMHIIAKARVSLYEGRGEFQLIIEHLEEAGVGKLQREFEALKKRLSERGLFDTRYKKALPRLPKCIGVVTSATGAAIRDILHVLKRRFSAASVIIYPTLVQGELAANNIVNAIETANRRKECDAIILARGGGSIEDLWPFNEEVVAHAIFHSKIPIITGIGHEIDFTIADFVADVRAPTPSAAAELLTPDQNELVEFIQQSQKILVRLLTQHLQRLKQQIEWINKQIQQQHPKRKLSEQTQQLDHLEATLIRLQLKQINDLQVKLDKHNSKLHYLTPAQRIREATQELILQKQQLITLTTHSLQAKKQLFLALTAKLEALSPLATLQRGFAIATNDHKTILRSTKQVKKNEIIHLQLMDGFLDCEIKKIDR